MFEEYSVIIATVPHPWRGLTKTPSIRGFLTGMATINLYEFFGYMLGVYRLYYMLGIYRFYKMLWIRNTEYRVSHVMSHVTLTSQ